jgi:23S rRNA (cytidine1920-2'-O)/16S rRNA (cytidine1409-2'-O)-methyltransferase
VTDADGQTLTKPAQRVGESDPLAVRPDPSDPGFASRAGHKLAGALDAFEAAGLTVSGRRCLDVGASTGGFTDVLLRRGAGEVVCLDVGHDQLVRRLRDDPRTVVLEGHNVRHVTARDIGGRADLAVADVSFISLVLVVPVLHGLVGADGDLVVMVKPQFEVGRGRLGAGGVVRDPADRRAAVRQVATAAADLGWGVQHAVASPLPGPTGNHEYFLWLRAAPARVDVAALDRVVDAAAPGERLGR